MLRPFIVKVSVLGYFPLHLMESTKFNCERNILNIYKHKYSIDNKSILS